METVQLNWNANIWRIHILIETWRDFAIKPWILFVVIEAICWMRNHTKVIGLLAV